MKYQKEVKTYFNKNGSNRGNSTTSLLQSQGGKKRICTQLKSTSSLHLNFNFTLVLPSEPVKNQHKYNYAIENVSTPFSM